MKTAPKDGRLGTCIMCSTAPTIPQKSPSITSVREWRRKVLMETKKMGKKRAATTDNKWKVFNWFNRSEKMNPYLAMEGAKKQSDLYCPEKFSEGSVTGW